jgi:phage tail tape-measure protein
VSEARRSFWSSVPGLVTGLAGVLTAVVGLVAVLIQLGVIGGKGASSGTGGTTGTSVAGSGSTSSTAEPRTFEVRPTTLDFPPTAAREQTLTVRNTSASGALGSLQSTFTGGNSDRFSVSGVTCNSALPPNGTCTLKVTFTPPSGATLQKYSATLRVSAKDAPQVAEVSLTASIVIG